MKKTGRGAYAIWAVNRSAPASGPTERDQSKLNYVCTTPTHRIAIETIADGTLRYRSWRMPHPITGAADLTIHKGKQTFEGTGVCTVPVYTFKNGSTIYKIGADIGCVADSGSGVPDHATGDIEITNTRLPGAQTHVWCF